MSYKQVYNYVVWSHNIHNWISILIKCIVCTVQLFKKTLAVLHVNILTRVWKYQIHKVSLLWQDFLHNYVHLDILKPCIFSKIIELLFCFFSPVNRASIWYFSIPYKLLLVLQSNLWTKIKALLQVDNPDILLYYTITIVGLDFKIEISKDFKKNTQC